MAQHSQSEEMFLMSEGDAAKVPDAPSPASPKARAARRLAAAAAAATTAGLLVALLAAARPGPGPGGGPQGAGLAEVVELSSARHPTPFGPAPHTLNVAGVECPKSKHSDTIKLFNGAYNWAGKNPDGRGIYKHSKHPLWIYYDKNCSLNGNTIIGEWMLTHKKPDTTRTKDVDEDGKCVAFGELLQITRKRHKIFMRNHGGFDFEGHRKTHPYLIVDSPAGAVPPGRATWLVFCPPYGLMKMDLDIGGAAAIQIQGRWRYVRTTFPGEKVTITSGVEKSSTDGGAASGEIEAAMSASGSVGLKFIGPKLDAEVSAGVKGSLETTWETSVSSTTEKTLEFELPNDNANLIQWQWVFDVRNSRGQVAGTVKSLDLAFTPSRARPPKCYPGFCSPDDCPHYQVCEAGYEI